MYSLISDCIGAFKKNRNDEDGARGKVFGVARAPQPLSTRKVRL